MIHRASTVMTRMPPQSAESGVVMAALFEHTFSPGSKPLTAADDVLEIGFLPSGCKLIEATLIGAGFEEETADIGFMSGNPGDNKNPDGGVRTTDNALFAGTALEGTAAKPPEDVLPMERAASHRSIGVRFSGDIAPAGQTIWLLAKYTA